MLGQRRRRWPNIEPALGFPAACNYTVYRPDARQKSIVSKHCPPILRVAGFPIVYRSMSRAYTEEVPPPRVGVQMYRNARKPCPLIFTSCYPVFLRAYTQSLQVCILHSLHFYITFILSNIVVVE